ncbi:hypothetical protein [Actomonas aquatica]|uniref:Uncharacterized protein n=1 Tax=Actomonas aquatica TaxID=2866162 RepID=A0ABZ1C4Q3_9BACT|nr:hypothetical protein [Opitutus sp. WL0086]WRQ86711.1 hypothetical protein K1X11_018010 [Opitutus sp. WL0086]
MSSAIPARPASSPTTSFRIRPRFEEILPDSPEEVRERLLTAFGADTTFFEVKTYDGFVGIHICGEERHRWSPRLHLSIDAADGGCTHVRGVYGPELEVWAFFIYGYVMCGLLGMFAAIYGCAQLFIGQSPWGLWVTGGMALIAVGLYLVAQLGQKLASCQTLRLHQAYHQAVGTAPQCG